MKCNTSRIDSTEIILLLKTFTFSPLMVSSLKKMFQLVGREESVLKFILSFFLWLSTVENAYNMSSLIFYTHSLDNTCLTQKNGDTGGPLTNVHLWPLMSCRFHLKFQVHSHPPVVLWLTITFLLFTAPHTIQYCLVYIPNLNSNLFLIHVNDELL